MWYSWLAGVQSIHYFPHPQKSPFIDATGEQICISIFCVKV